MTCADCLCVMMRPRLIKDALWIDTTEDMRTIRILLPQGYETSRKTYPVLYMHDGQNLFEDDTAYDGHSWGIAETLSDLQDKGLVEEMIVVGIDNAPNRVFEYTPWESDMIKERYHETVGGHGDRYASWVVETLIPTIEKRYRVRKDSESRMIAGSSLGAYISVYIAVSHPGLFGVVGVFSLASWFNEKDWLAHIRQRGISPEQRYFISIGDQESSDDNVPEFNQIYVNTSRAFNNLLQEQGVRDICYLETHDIHHESAWRKVFVDFILWVNKK